MRRESNVTYMIGKLTGTVDENSDITVEVVT